MLMYRVLNKVSYVNSIALAIDPFLGWMATQAAGPAVEPTAVEGAVEAAQENADPVTPVAGANKLNNNNT